MYEAFIKLRDKDKQINHKDGNKTNNHVSNLEEVSPSENTRHAYVQGLATGKSGDSNSMSKLSNQTLSSCLVDYLMVTATSALGMISAYMQDMYLLSDTERGG